MPHAQRASDATFSLCPASKGPHMKQSELVEIVAGRIWASERPVWFSGVRLRARTSVIRLDDGRLLIHSPTPPTDGWVKQVAALGEVSWLVVPNCFHHLGTPAAAAAFPAAKIVAPQSAAAKSPALRIDIDVRELSTAIPECVAIPLEGVPFLDETLLFHRPTGTLFGADVVLCADESDHWSWRFAARVVGCYKRLRVPPDVKNKVADKAAASRSLHALAGLPIQRLVIAHGHVIEDEPVAKLLEAWRMVGVA
ncbi:MAG: DUF4336 domain-containing protein [Kofleriaceae bacterium]